MIFRCQRYRTTRIRHFMISHPFCHFSHLVPYCKPLFSENSMRFSEKRGLHRRIGMIK
nr:MAG TPA: hypothetical protein [Caudoviricetes sp.]